MMVDWLVYCLTIAALVSVAGWLAERGARARGWPTRWIWLGALALSVGLPLAAWLSPGSGPAAPSIVAVPTTLVLESMPAVSMAGGEGAADPTTLALAAWAALSLLILMGIGALALRLHRRRRGWSRDTVEGVAVWVSRRTGPAALGVLRGHVVIPEWALSLDAGRRRLLVLHEAEHVRARDPQLALAGLVVCALVPWSLPLWWQLRRLRLAIEMDCDERVLRRAGDARGYGSLLLEVCQRKAHLALALAESRSMLERRIRMITRTTTGHATLRAIGLAAVAGLVLAVACETPGPTGPADAGSNEIALDEIPAEWVNGECPPTYFINGSRSSRGVVDDLEPSAIESINVFKGEAIPVPEGTRVCGVVAILTKSAGVDGQAAHQRIVEQLSAERRSAAGQEAPAVQTLEEVKDGPTFTPMTVRPRLRNPEAVQAGLQEQYPSSLREQGVGGTSNVWILIDGEGAVQRVLVNESSGWDEMDRAALDVARSMEFTPAYNRDQRVPVWVALDITFETAEPEPEPVYRAREVEPAPEPEHRVREMEPAPAPEFRAREVEAKPEVTPMTDEPRLRNADQVRQWIQEAYPESLREQGIGGTANLWFFIDETGTVQRLMVNQSSGYDELDRAALQVASGMEFEPARNGDEAVAVWVALDIRFETQ